MTSKQELDDIVGLFTISPQNMPRISTSTTKPNYTSLKLFQDAINKQALCIPYEQTTLGALALVIPDAEFTTVNGGTPFVIPNNPGTAPTNPVPPTRQSTTTRTGGTTIDPAHTAAIAMLPYTGPEALRQYNERLQEFRRHRAATVALKNLIINAVDDQYISAKKHPITQYAQVTPLELLTHLWDTYGTIDEADNRANEERMKEPWAPPVPIENLFKQLEEGQAFAVQGNEIISDAQLVRWGYENIQSTGLFDSDCTKWRKKPAADRTWTKFKEYFLIAEDDRMKNATSNEAQFTANQVHQILQHEMAAYLNTLKTPTEQQPEQVPIITETANAVIRTVVQTETLKVCKICKTITKFNR